VSEDIDTEFFRETLDALTETAMDGLSQVVQKLVDYYVEHHDLDTNLAYNQTLIALSTVTGEVIACMVDEDNIRDFVEEKCKENISVSRKTREDLEGEIHTTEDDPNGLSRMTPLGEC